MVPPAPTEALKLTANKQELKAQYSQGGGEAVLGHKNSSVPFICSTDDEPVASAIQDSDRPFVP